MKSFVTLLILVLALSAEASLVTSNMFTLATVNNATNTTAITTLGNIYTPAVTFSIQNTGLSTTNALGVDIQYGFATNSMTNTFTYQPSVTNATIDSFTPPNNGVLTIYARAIIRTTNSVTVGVQAIQQK